MRDMLNLTLNFLLCTYQFHDALINSLKTSALFLFPRECTLFLIIPRQLRYFMINNIQSIRTAHLPFICYDPISHLAVR